MTLTSRARAALTLLAAASVAVPSVVLAAGDGRLTPPAAAASAPRGVFDVVLQAHGGLPVPAKILVEQKGDRVEVTLIVDQRVSAMRVVRSDAQSLQASVPTTDGAARLTMRVDGDAVDGTLTAPRTSWKVRGARSL